MGMIAGLRGVVEGSFIGFRRQFPNSAEVFGAWSRGLQGSLRGSRLLNDHILGLVGFHKGWLQVSTSLDDLCMCLAAPASLRVRND